jgi:glyoxylase-like metal-dependent hydrolase (beta-lactamase superfamily II)
VHADHSGGLVVGGKMMFPNATIHVHQAELDHWFDTQEEANAPAHQKHSFAQGRASLDPYIKAGHVKAFSGETTVLPGIRTMPAPGHTPGHTFYAVESNGQTLVLWGDTVHVAQVQFPDPTIAITFDTDAGEARAQREAVFADAAKNRYLVAAAHIAFPGIGHVRQESGSYSWVPVDYSIRLTAP